MNVGLFAKEIHNVFGSNLNLLMEIVEERRKGVNQQLQLVQVGILIDQLVMNSQNAILIQQQYQRMSSVIKGLLKLFRR